MMTFDEYCQLIEEKDKEDKPEKKDKPEGKSDKKDGKKLPPWLNKGKEDKPEKKEKDDKKDEGFNPATNPFRK